MSELGYAWAFGIIGSIASIIGLIIALVQTYKLAGLKAQVKSKIWSDISTIKALMEDLENGKCEIGHARACEQFRDLLREASLIEKNYTLDTINLWRKTGKLSSVWQQKQAMALLDKECICPEKAETLNEVYANWDAYSFDHPYAQGKPTMDSESFQEEIQEEGNKK